MTTTPVLGAQELVPAQAIPETTENQRGRRFEQGAQHFSVKDKDLATPPGSPADGDAYIVAASPTGAWTGQAKAIAYYQSGTGWLFITPREGMYADANDEDTLYRYSGLAWAPYSAGAAGGLLAANNLSDVANVATALANLGLTYGIGLFFTTAPSASEVLCLHIAAVAFTIPANFATPTSKGAVGTNPAASFAIDVQRQVNATGAFSTIGTITISTGGAFTFATASGTAKAIAVNDVLKFVGPSSADASIANVAMTILGAR